MGILNTIKNTVTDLYNKADTALGGALPGGVPSTTPSTQPTQTTQPVVSQPTSNKDNPYSVPQTVQQAYNLPAVPTTTTTSSNKSSNSGLDNFTKQATQSPQEAYNIQSSGPTSNMNNITPSAGSNQTMESVAAQSYNPNTQTTSSPSVNAQDQSLLERYKTLAGLNKQGVTNDNLGIGRDLSGLTPEQINQMGLATPINSGDFFNVATLGTGLGGNMALQTSKITAEQAAKYGAGIAAEVAEKKAAELALKQATVLSTKEAVVVADTLKTFETVGAEALAGNTAKIAANIAPEVGTNVAGKVATNSATIKTAIEAIKDVLTTNGIVKATAIGAAIVYTLKSSFTGAGFVKTDVNNFAQSIGFHLQELREAGMNDEADTLIKEAQDLSDGLDTVIAFIPFGVGQFIEEGKMVKYNNDLTNILDDFAKNKVSDQTFADMVDSKLLKGETVSKEDLEKASKMNPYGAASKLITAESVANANIDKKAKESQMATRMQGMSNVQIISDPDITAFATDPSNSYSVITKLYNSAMANYIESTNPDNYFGNNYQGTGKTGADLKTEQTQTYTQPSTQDTYQPPSSLNFGLLKTSGGYMSGPKDSTKGTLVTDTGTVSEYYFGVPYSQLTAEQKSLVDLMTS